MTMDSKRDFAPALRALLCIGRREGWLTYDDVTNAVPEDATESEIEETVHAILEAGVSLEDSVDNFESYLREWCIRNELIARVTFEEHASNSIGRGFGESLDLDSYSSPNAYFVLHQIVGGTRCPDEFQPGHLVQGEWENARLVFLGINPAWSSTAQDPTLGDLIDTRIRFHRERIAIGSRDSSLPDKLVSVGVV